MVFYYKFVVLAAIAQVRDYERGDCLIRLCSLYIDYWGFWGGGITPRFGLKSRLLVIFDIVLLNI